METKEQILKEFQQIPGVGPSLSEDLWRLGLRSLDDLKQCHPQDLYDQLCALEGTHVDRCVLYVFRLAVYFATHTKHDPALLQWWKWKDRE